MRKVKYGTCPEQALHKCYKLGELRTSLQKIRSRNYKFSVLICATFFAMTKSTQTRQVCTI